MFEIVTFYKFTPMGDAANLERVRDELRSVMRQLDIRGTVIVANEGFNSTVSGESSNVAEFIRKAKKILGAGIEVKRSMHDQRPFRRIDVKIKPEIVTLKKDVDVSKGEGTHVGSKEWNHLLSDPEVFVLDTRNDYEYRSGTFQGAVNPQTEKFSELPGFVEQNLDPKVHKKVAMFCTGGIRCEKFAPYLVARGFQEVFQLEGGILRYLEEISDEDSLWEGECFVFDDRVTVDEKLRKGTGTDHSVQKGRSAN